MKKVLNKKIILSIVLISFLALTPTLVLAQNPILDPIYDWFLNWEEGNFSPNIAKYLLWVLITLIIFSIAKRIPGLGAMFKESDILGWIFSIIVAFLALAYITPDEVYALMIAYSAMGFTIGAIIPFIILVTWTATLATSRRRGGGGVVSRNLLIYAIWTLFTVFIIYRIVTLTITKDSPGWYMWALIIIGLACLFMIFGGFNILLKKMRRIADEAVINEAQAISQIAARRERQQAQSAETAAGE